MKKTNAPKSTENRVTGSVDPTIVARGVLRTPAGGVHGGKGRERDERRKDLERRTNEVAPPGWEGTVKAMKKHKDIDNPYALAWSMKKKGYKSHKPEHTKKKKKKMNEGFLTFSEWLENKQAKVDEIYGSTIFDPAKQAGYDSGNPLFSRYTKPGETKLPGWMAAKGYTSTMQPDNALNIKSFEVEENQSDKSITISGTTQLERDLADQITGKPDFGRNVARIGGEQLMQKKDPNDRWEVGKEVYKNAVIFLHDKFGQLKALLDFYLVRKGYEKANLVVVPNTLRYIDKLFKQYNASVPNFMNYAKTMIIKSIKSVCRDLGLFYDENTNTVTKNTTGAKMAKTAKGSPRHESGVRSYTGGKIQSSHREKNYGSPIGFLDPRA